MPATKTTPLHLVNGQIIEVTNHWYDGDGPLTSASGKTAKKYRRAAEVKSAERIDGSRRWMIDTSEGAFTADSAEKITVVG